MSEAAEEAGPGANPAGELFEARPTVFIGLGGAGTLVLRALRRRLSEQAGASTIAGDVRLLALDTDLASLRAAEAAPDGESLLPDEMLHLPLRKPAEYRAASDEILSWLSRRWLYNIPRSLHTEGLRPLGRLAFVDHRLTISARLRRVLAGASPRIFIAASIDGGAGGGMLFDLAYSIRQQLDELKLPTDCMHGLMLHATLARHPANDLRKANAYATLTELNHFMLGGAAYRSGPIEVLPAGDVSEPPFVDAYLVDLGENLAEPEFDCALRQVADYLYLNATACGEALDDFRRRSRDKQEAGDVVVRLRAFGLHAVRIDKQVIAKREADRLCLRLMHRWLGESDGGGSPAPRIQPPDFALDDLAQRVQAIVNKALGGSAETHFRTVVAADAGRPALVRDDDPAGPFGDELRRIHAVLGLPTVLQAAQPAQLTRLEAALREGTQQLAAAMGDGLVASMVALVEQADGRVPAALAGASLYLEHLRDLRQAAEELLRRDRGEATALWSKLQRGELPRQRSWLSRLSAVADDPENCLLEYCRLRLRAMVYQHLVGLLHEVSGKIAAFNERLVKLRQSIQWLSTEITAEARARGNPAPGLEESGLPLAAELSEFAGPEYLAAFDRSLTDSLLNAAGGLLVLADEGPDRWRELGRQFCMLARRMVLKSLAHVDAAYLLQQQHPSQQQLAAAISDRMAECSSPLRIPGTQDRLFAVLPQGPSSEPIANLLRDSSPPATILARTGADLIFLREIVGISLSEAATKLVQDRSDCAEAARRVLTRVDVNWTALETQNLAQ
jgi:hypothetical protein